MRGHFVPKFYWLRAAEGASLQSSIYVLSGGADEESLLATKPRSFPDILCDV